MRASKSIDRCINMCDTCKFTFAECATEVIEFGDGVGNDNVVVCSSYMVKPFIGDIDKIILAPELGVFKRTNGVLRE